MVHRRLPNFRHPLDGLKGEPRAVRRRPPGHPETTLWPSETTLWPSADDQLWNHYRLLNRPPRQRMSTTPADGLDECRPRLSCPQPAPVKLEVLPRRMTRTNNRVRAPTLHAVMNLGGADSAGRASPTSITFHNFSQCHLAKRCRSPNSQRCVPLDHQAFNGNSSLDHWELLLLNNRDVHDLDGELQQCNLHRFLHGQDHGHLSLHNSGHANNHVQDSQLWNLHKLPHSLPCGYLSQSRDRHCRCWEECWRR